MKSVRLAAFGAAIALGVSAAAIAQPPARTGRVAIAGDTTRARGGHERLGKHGARALFENVKLSKEQRDQLRVIQKKYAEQRKTFVQQARAQSGNTTAKPDSATRARIRSQVRALSEKQAAEMRAVLTPDQQKQFDANAARVRDTMQSRRGKHAKRGA